MIKIDNLKCYNVQETAKLLGVSATTIRMYIKSGKLKAQKVGTAYAITEQSIKKYLNSAYVREEK